MSGAEDAAAALRDAMRRLALPAADDSAPASLLHDAHALAQALPAALTAAWQANSLDGAMSGALSAILAAEAAADAYKAAARAAEALGAQCNAVAKGGRNALAQTLAATGAPRAECETHSATPTEPSLRVVIDDPALLPFDLTTSKTVPDIAAIRAALTARRPVPGARLDGGEPGLRIQPKRKSRG